MSCILIRMPHALDPIWDFALAQMQNADDVMEAAEGDAAMDAAADLRTAAIAAIMALPVRNFEDIVHKFNCDVSRTDVDADVIIEEMVDLLNVACGPRVAIMDWQIALETFDAARAAAHAQPISLDKLHNEDALNQVWFDAADYLIDTAAPDHAALVRKMEILRERWDGFEIPDEVFSAILKDVRNLGGLA